MVCPYHCRQNESMKRHLRKHTKDKPYECGFCSLKFSRRDNLRRHLKDQHSYDSFRSSTKKPGKYGVLIVKGSNISTMRVTSPSSQELTDDHSEDIEEYHVKHDDTSIQHEETCVQYEYDDDERTENKCIKEVFES
ncbi:zinc finger protein Pegasus-like [Diaphorina citri]|uniref:Zinc finger protein Pegasus-like n=1 Tax=Diaphorina citri TaxID=121845 RepID=A0A3Q0IPV1_DIACI|nr:zinc finger protein Pegasus-like [Diaphorina citri]